MRADLLAVAAQDVENCLRPMPCPRSSAEIASMRLLEGPLGGRPSTAVNTAASLRTNPIRALASPYNPHAWRFPPASASAPTKSPPKSALVAWARSIARQTRTLKRAVAIKILPETVGERSRSVLARFQREAEVLASLNHPNIAPIYGLEKSRWHHGPRDGTGRGADAGRPDRAGANSRRRGLPIARQIAEALEAAHEQGIIHRDLKPANIKLRPDGAVKVLDFGLAKAMDGPLSGSSGVLDVADHHDTGDDAGGVILGTAAYMSPEQAKGKPADRRADIWAFGVVLFEMVTGRQLFTGETAAETWPG